jgi:hypothetical protein
MREVKRMEKGLEKRRCDWRTHPLAQAPCGHVFCATCAPALHSGESECPYCVDAWDAADELMNAPAELHC